MTLDRNALRVKGKTFLNPQDEHIKIYNEQGRIMASLADYYEAGKSGDKALIRSLRKDFTESVVIGSDRIVYSRDSLDAKIVRYFGSTVVKPVKVKVFIPDYSFGPRLDDVLDDNAMYQHLDDMFGLAYIQALFNTSDDADTIESTLDALSGKSRDRTIVWTSNRYSRKNNPKRATFLGYLDDDFLIDGDDYLIQFSGRSRGMQLAAAGERAEKS